LSFKISRVYWLFQNKLISYILFSFLKCHCLLITYNQIVHCELAFCAIKICIKFISYSIAIEIRMRILVHCLLIAIFTSNYKLFSTSALKMHKVQLPIMQAFLKLALTILILYWLISPYSCLWFIYHKPLFL
jgi:hypothetical protein